MDFYLSYYHKVPEPPKELWLTIDYSKINFSDMEHIEFIIRHVPETYTKINSMYKAHTKNIYAFIDIFHDYNIKIKPPKIMKKIHNNFKC